MDPVRGKIFIEDGVWYSASGRRLVISSDGITRLGQEIIPSNRYKKVKIGSVTLDYSTGEIFHEELIYEDSSSDGKKIKPTKEKTDCSQNDTCELGDASQLKLKLKEKFKAKYSKEKPPKEKSAKIGQDLYISL